MVAGFTVPEQFAGKVWPHAQQPKSLLFCVCVCVHCVCACVRVCVCVCVCVCVYGWVGGWMGEWGCVCVYERKLRRRLHDMIEKCSCEHNFLIVK